MPSKKPKKARLKLGADVLQDDGQIEYVKKIQLNIDGKSGGTVGPAPVAQSIRVHVRLFYRVNGVPFASMVHEGNVNVADADTPFSLAAAFPFTPRHRTVHSFRVLAWDKTAAGDVPTDVKQIRTHAVRLRVRV